MQKVVQLLHYTRRFGHKKYKFSFLTFVLTTLILIFSFQVKSQDLSVKKIDLSIQSASIKEALMIVQKQSGITFVYNPDINKYAALKITAAEKGISVKEAIELILKNTNLRYVQMDDQVVVDEKPAQKSPDTPTGKGPGKIKGRIVEFETSMPLPGATVYLVELKKGIATDASGYYQMTNIPAGKYNLQVSYIGFTMENVPIEIKAGREESYDVKLRGSTQVDEVVISGIRKSRASVAHTSEKQIVMEIKSLQSVVSGISSEQISKSADRNAAEVVRKIAGVTVKDDKFIIIRGMNERYNLTYLNGNLAPSTELYSRAFSLDLIPSRIIDRILVFKSPSPDLSADMTGGAVKIFTKESKNVRHFDIELQMGVRPNTTFNSNFRISEGGKTDLLGFDDGTRKLPSSVPGYGKFTQANISQKVYAETFNPSLKSKRITALPNLQLTANYFNTIKIGKRYLSFLTALSYKNDYRQNQVYKQQGNRRGLDTDLNDKVSFETQSTHVAQLNLIQNFKFVLKDSSNIQFKNFVLQQGQDNVIDRFSGLTSFDANGNFRPDYDVNKDHIMSYVQRFLYTGNLEGNHYLGKGRHLLQWNVGYSHSNQQLPDQRVIRLRNIAGSTRGLSGDMGTYNGVELFGDSALNWTARGRGKPGPASIQSGIISRLWTRNTESVYSASVDYTFKIMPWLTLKTGTWQQWKERLVFRRVYLVNEGDLRNNSNDYFLGGHGDYIDYNIVQFKEYELDKVWSTTYLRDDASGLKVYDRTTGSDVYRGSEQNNSGYIALRLLPFNDKLDIYGGIRAEYNRQKVTGAVPAFNTGDINLPTFTDHAKLNWLPSVNVGYKPSVQLVLRGGYGKTLNRTELREVSSFSELDYINNQNITGYSNLVPAEISNYDARAEWYPGNSGESVSIGVFYKDLLNPIERVMFHYRLSDGTVLPRITYRNADKATISGLEIDLHKKLDFVPLNFFRKLSVIGNVTLMKSEAVRGETTEPNAKLYAFKRPLQGQAPYIINAGLYYDNAASGTKASVSYSRTGERIYAASLGNAPLNGYPSLTDGGWRGSTIELPMDQVDLAFTQRIIKSMQVKFSIQNLLNQPVLMAEDGNFTYKYEPEYWVPLTNGVAKGYWGGDNISARYNPGPHYVLSISYSF